MRHGCDMRHYVICDMTSSVPAWPRPPATRDMRHCDIRPNPIGKARRGLPIRDVANPSTPPSVSHFQPLSAAFSRFQRLSAAFSRFQRRSATFSSVQRLSAAHRTRARQRLSAAVSHFRQVSAAVSTLKKSAPSTPSARAVAKHPPSGNVGTTPLSLGGAIGRAS